jgi:hypothetical protein
MAQAQLRAATGVWCRMSLDTGGELSVSVEGPQQNGGFSFTILFMSGTLARGRGEDCISKCLKKCDRHP